MKKLLLWFDNNILKILVAFLIAFTALYPKLPSINIPHTWVYIRLEDFVILFTAVVWFVQLLRKKVSLPKPEGYVLVLYWLAGLVSLIYCLLFVAPHLANFFPNVAALQYIRRIEYMILFFVGFSSIRRRQDLIDLLKTLAVTVLCVVVYGFGQKFYLIFWKLSPDFFVKHPFCFPAFLTGNEEFAKGVPMCLSDASRISSTFGGHYDLAAYLVFVVPLFIALFIIAKNWLYKIVLAIVSILGLEVLNFTSSRTSFAGYLAAIVVMLILWQKKRWIAPILIVSIAVMLLFSNSTLARFGKTVQQVNVVTVQPGADAEMQKLIKKTKEAEENKTPESPPPGTVIVGAKTATSSSQATTAVITDKELATLNKQDLEISSVSGSFLIHKAYSLDISFTTRFQAEWPRDWKAFLSSPIFGTGFSSLTLASDNDYLRALGESGVIGFATFLFIFVILGIFMKNTVANAKDPVLQATFFGLAGGVIGLLLNAALIDVFEASKVAEPLWILLGIGVGAASVQKPKAINYTKELYAFFTSRAMIGVYFFILIMIAFLPAVHNYFIADDFVWLNWAANANLPDLPGYFINSHGFFYRPLDKSIVYFLYLLFSLQPEGYHIFTILLHFLTALGVYLLTHRLFKQKLVAFLATLLFALHPVATENLFWFSTISETLGTMFIVYALLAFLHFRRANSIFGYVCAILLSIFAYLSHEIAVVIPFCLLTLDLIILKTKKPRAFLFYIPFVIFEGAYFVIRSLTHTFSSGGDYSYSLPHFIPNVIGNFLGYIGLYFGGVPFMTEYVVIRNGLRGQALIWGIVGVTVIVAIALVIYNHRKTVLRLYKKPEINFIVFGLIFALATLLPFLPLGNLAPRYNYLASIGFSITFVSLMWLVADHYFVTKKMKHIALGIIAILFLGIYLYQINVEKVRWQTAGNITQKTLLFFRTNYASFTPQDTVFISNTPVQYNGIWIFPNGLKEGIWFIYREMTPQVHQVVTLDEAKAAAAQNIQGNNYIFTFDENGKISEVKNEK